MNKKTKLRIALASATLVVAATGTALASGGSSSGSGSGSERPSTAQNVRGEQDKQQAPAVVKADGANLFPHSPDFDAPSKSFYVGSLKHGTVSTVGTDGKVRTF
ncbi:hypothetical protein ACH4B4_42805, partial [Streptomyces tendae]